MHMTYFGVCNLLILNVNMEITSLRSSWFGVLFVKYYS